MPFLRKNILLLALTSCFLSCSQSTPLKNDKKPKLAKQKNADDSKASTDSAVFIVEKLPQDVVNLSCQGALEFSFSLVSAGSKGKDAVSTASDVYPLVEGANFKAPLPDSM
jgi:hypothetical protein